MNMFKVSAVALVLFSAHAQANDTWVEVNGLSNHIGQETYTYKGETKKFNEVNLGLGLSKEVHKNVEVKAGFYENSYYKNTLYAGGMFHINFQYKDVKIKPGILAGVATGYDDTVEQAAKVQPIVYGLVNVEYKRARIGVGYLPSRMFGRNVDVVSVQVGFKL